MINAGAEKVASGNSTTTTPVGTSAPVTVASRLLSWSDAQAVKDKVDLAKRLGVRGISIFKIDGGEDQGIWSVLR